MLVLLSPRYYNLSNDGDDNDHSEMVLGMMMVMMVMMGCCWQLLKGRKAKMRMVVGVMMIMIVVMIMAMVKLMIYISPHPCSSMLSAYLFISFAIAGELILNQERHYGSDVMTTQGR